MGLEPTNLLTASQALYQLSYAPVALVGATIRVLRPFPEWPFANASQKAIDARPGNRLSDLGDPFPTHRFALLLVGPAPQPNQAVVGQRRLEAFPVDWTHRAQRPEAGHSRPGGSNE